MLNRGYINYLKVGRKAQMTIDSYVKYIDEMLDFIGKPDDQITRQDMLDWQQSLGHLSSSSVGVRISAVKSYFKYLEKMEMIEVNPTNILVAPEIKHKEKPYMTKEMVSDMVVHCRTKRDKAIVLLMASTGVRVSELINLTLDQYFNMDGEDGREIVLHITKRGNERRIYINDATKEAIDDYLLTRHDDCDKLFASFQGGVIHRNNLNLTIKNIAKNAGIPFWEDVTNHSLRSACATIMNENNVPLPVISKALGHANVRTTMIYVKTEQKQTNNAMKAMVF